MSGAVGRLVARGARPPLPIGRSAIGPSVVDVAPEADDRPGPAPAEYRGPELASAQAAAPAARTPSEPPTRSTATTVDPAARERTAEPDPSAAADRSDTAFLPPGGVVGAAPRPNPADAPIASGHAAPAPTRPLRKAAARSAVAPAPGPPSPPDAPEPLIADAAQPGTRPNPIGRRLEAAAVDRVASVRSVDLVGESGHFAPTPTPTPTAMVRPRTVSPARPRADAMPPGGRDHAAPLPVPPAPSVTIGTIEVVTPTSGPVAPAPLAALDARRRSGRARWTGRAR